MGRLKDKIAIVTGAAQGIGYITGKRLAEEGAKIVAADLNFEGAEELAKEINSNGGEAIAISTNVTEEDSVVEMVSKTVEHFGRVDILHNNAGGNIGGDEDITTLEMDVWEKSLDLNLKGAMLGMKHVVPEMIKQGGGSIINASSGAALTGDLSNTAYAAAKSGVETLTRYAATQYGKQNIRCNAIAPGVILTPLTKDLYTEELMEVMTNHNVLPRLGEPEDIANTVVFLGSDESSYITGQVFGVDGGFLMHSPAFADFMNM